MMPGSVTSQMPPQDDDPQRRQRDADRLAREVAAGKSGQAMQIGDGGILINGTGGLTIAGTGSLNVGSGALNSAGSISAATTITAGGNITGGGLISTGGASVAGAMGVGGALSSGSHTVTGDINVSGDLYTPHGRATPVTSNYVAAYLNNDGRLGATASSAAVKVDLAAMDAADAAKLLAITPYWGRYMWDDPESPMKAFLLAEDVQAAGFGPDIAPVVDGDTAMNIGTEEQPVLMQPGQAWTINEAKLVPSLLAIVRMQQAQIDALTSRLDAAGL